MIVPILIIVKIILAGTENSNDSIGKFYPNLK